MWFDQLNKPNTDNGSSFTDMTEFAFYQGFTLYSTSDRWVVNLAKAIRDQNELAKYLFDPLMPEKLVRCRYKENNKFMWMTVIEYDEEKGTFCVIDENGNPEEIDLFSDRGSKEWEQSFDDL